jgi:hypothetical protein
MIDAGVLGLGLHPGSEKCAGILGMVDHIFGIASTLV